MTFYSFTKGVVTGHFYQHHSYALDNPAASLAHILVHVLILINVLCVVTSFNLAGIGGHLHRTGERMYYFYIRNVRV